MKKKKRPERPIDLSKLIDKHIERGGMPLSFGGEYLPVERVGTADVKLALKTIGPKGKKKEDKKDEDG